MTLDELIIIKKAADVTRLDRNILGAAVMYNLEYGSVRPQHVTNFKTMLYNTVGARLMDCKVLGEIPSAYKTKIVYENSTVPKENPWDNILSYHPGN